MTSFCRITGCSRNLPKPCYFPLLPPITPAEAKKLCRITGKASEIHSYSPVIAFGKPIRFDGTEGCKITKNESLIYTRPVFEKTKDNENSYSHLETLLKKMKSKLKKQSETDREFVYYLSEQKTNLLVPPEMEEAIRKGELETVSVSKDCKFVNIKIKQGRIVKLNLRTLQFSEVEEREELYYGRGQNKDVMEEQQEILNERNKRKANTMARKQRFEALDAKAEAEELRDTVKPVYNKPRVKFNAKQRAEKLAKMEAMMREQAENKAILLPKVDTKKLQDEQLQYERFLADIMEAQVTSIKLVIVSSGLDWHAVTVAENAGFDWESFPHEEWIDPVEVVESQVAKEEVMLRDDVTSLEIVVSVETVRPSLPMPEEVAREVYHMKDDVLKKTEHVTETLQSVRDAEMIPSFSEISKVAAGTETMEVGYLVKKKEGAEFVTKLDYVENEEEAVSGALVEIDEKKKFVAGQIIKLADQEAFVAGQTVETPQGKKFVPGQTIINKNGDINFVPGQSVKSLEEKIDFVAGQVFNSTNGPKFVAGQVMDLGDGKSVFVAGQTVTTEDGPKFSPGEVTVNAYGEDIFVPGLKMPSAEGETFVTGQAFQSEEGLTFKPGQIMDTIEGPTFVPGKIFETPEGKKFIKGDLVQDEEGKLKFEHRPFEVPKISEWLVIPNKELQPLAFADRNVSGFIVNPTNTDTILVGEKLYGDMVETQNAVQFYLTGKLPKDVSPDSKVIPGQLIVNEVDKRFIPGKLMTTADGESFVPGQTVNTSHGEEFIPGQIVESSDGPKFVPGQVVMTAKGEKFVPGQVIVEDEGPKFVPGQIIQTKNGATFIPGQMMSTDEGQLFVPGQLVETNAGPRFVPGQVVESPEGPKFIPGTIIETDEGLKYVPPDADEIDEDFQISFQGFEISEEELALLMTNPADIRPHSPIMSDEGLIDSATLKKLAMNTVFVHGVTPEPPPPPPEKKKKKKKARVQLDAAEENGKEEVEEPDYGTDKVDVLLRFIRASTSISGVRRGKEMKKLSKLLGEREYDNMTLLQVDAMANILSTVNGTGEVVRVFLGEDEQLISDIVDYIDSTDTDAISRNDQARRTLRKAIQRVVSKYCDKEIDDIIHLLNINPENLLTNTRIQVLLTEAVGIVCVTGNVEVAAMLERFISEPSDPNALRDNPDVVSVLRQLVVLHQIAERDTDVAKMLQVLQTNPEGLKDRKKVRELLKNANLLLKLPKVEDEDVSAFDLRHVASSKDIPAKIFEQIREDRKEADKFIDMLPDELFREIMQDKRCGESFLETLDSEKAGRAKSELDKFKKGMAIVVTKAEMQAVIPKEFARSICYGIVPYLLIDEEGFKFFERGLTGRKLAPAKVIENTWFMPDSYYAKKPSCERSMSGEQYSMVMLGKRRSSAARELLYTSLLPSSGPTRLSYSDGINGDLDDLLSYRRSSRASSSMWNDRKGLNGYGDYTPQRRGSQALSDFDDLDLPSSMPRRSSRGVTDLAGIDAGSFIYRRPTREELDDYGTTYSAVMPCNPVVLDDVSESTPLCRSDTVAKLLDKYTNFSTRREFGYHSPNSAWSRHVGQTRDFASRLPETRDVEPEPEDEDGFTPSDRAMMPTAQSGKHRAISDARDRSPRPLSANRDRSGFPEDTGLVPVGDSPKEGSRGLEGTYFPDTNLTRETSFIPQTRSSRRTVTPDEDPILSPLPTRRKPFRPAPQEDTEQVQDPLEPVPQVGRPGGALQRYMEKRAREAQVIQNQSDPLDEVDFRSRALRSSRGRQLQDDSRAQPPSGKGWVDQDDDLGAPIPRDLHGRDSQDLHRLVSEDRSAKGSQEQYGKSFQDPYERLSEDPYARGPVDLYGRGSQDLHGRASQDSYGRAPQDTYGRPLQDPYGRASHDPYTRAPQDPYGRASQEPYSRIKQESYGRASQEPYGQFRPDLNIRASQNTYGRDQGAEEAYGERSLAGRYSSDDPTLGGYSQRRPAHSAALDGYNQECSSYRGNYGTGNDTNYGGRGGYDTGVGYGSRYGSAYGGSRYGGNYAPSGGYGSSYDAGGGYGSSYDAGGSYGSSYDAGGSYGSSYDGGYSGTYRGTPNISTTGGYQVPPSSSGLGSGRQSVGRSLVTQNLLPNIDEEDSHTGRSLTPRQEERNRITILAQKYLNKPLGTTSND